MSASLHRAPRGSVPRRRRVLAQGLLAAGGLLTGLPQAAQAQAQPKVEITLARFFGACDADYGTVTDVARARGECGIITTLVNRFNATNSLGAVVKPQIAEWGPYYDQLTARIVAKDVPTVAVMHESVLGDFVRRGLVEPLDAPLARVGVPVADYTDHAARGTRFDGKTYALPFDTWSWLWHINLNHFRKAGLVQADGAPVLPRSPQELLAQARQFRQATGKPYFAWTTANETAAPTRTFLTLVAQQGGELFKDGGKRIDMRSPAATQALQLMQTLWNEGHVKKGLDYGATQQAFLSGDVGVNVVGTWTIDDFMKAADSGESPLKGGYTVVPFAQLYGRKAVFADGHSWVMLKGGAKDERQREAAHAFLKFLWDHNAEWARTGHLPVSRKVIDSAGFRALPMRAQILEIASTGQAMPPAVPRQRAVETIVGEEISNLMLAGKALPEVQAAVEQRVNRLLATAR
ncbi:MAG: hypothetical protein RL223_2333 [Pseudomonadota bacterium]